MYYKDLLRHRQSWLGFATLWILMFHLPIKIGFLSYLQTFGYGGVDICLFASGVGCYYSLCGNSDVGAFLKRRVKRMAPACLTVIAVWLLFRFTVGQFDIPMAVGNLLGLQSFTDRGQEFNWYISAIFLFYFLAPYLKAGTDKASPWGTLRLLLFLTVCTVPFLGVNNYMIIVTRLPIFYIGMILGSLSKREIRIKVFHWILLALSFVVGILFLWFSYKKLTAYLWSHGLFWYPFILIVPPLCAGLSCLLSVLEKWRFTRLISTVLSFVGDYSLELYLMQVLWVFMTPAFINKFDLDRFTDQIWAAGVVAVILGSFGLRLFTKLLNQLMNTKKN